MRKPNTKNKRPDKALGMKTFPGDDERTYLVFRTGKNSFHVFVEIEAKEAARRCGASPGGNTQTMWKSIWPENG